MHHIRHLLPFAFLYLCCLGCTEEAGDGESSSGEATAAESAVNGDDVGITGEVTVVSVVSREERLGDLFESVLPILDDARELVDQHAELPDSSRIPFTTDKQSNTAAINQLLDQAIDVLEISEVSDYRQQIRDAKSAIAASHAEIADCQRQRVSAPWAKNQSQIDQYNPFESSKETLDQLIDEERAEIERQEKLLVKLKLSFAKELSKIGVQVDEQGAESLLSSVSGDDIVSMAVVFDNVKNMTTQLQELTDESGEALDVAKRYYGMYVVMVHVMDRIQKSFIRDINEKHIPRLDEFAEQAKVNIEQAQKLIDIDGGDVEILESNIASNELTRNTAKLYVTYLQRNAELIATENERAQKNLATAINTYDTVKLSSEVAAHMNSGRRDLETLMNLEIPALREFDNQAIRKEFQRMTTELRGS
ncbi:MAG: hypothetical protein P8L85_02810 [Rubripirellula sp.]|nr:hypothetical protein [Rubripirellula sp.]